MKLFLLPLLLSAVGTIASGQSAKHVQWSYTAKKIADQTYEVHLKATIDKGYHLYAQNADANAAAATKFTFTRNPLTSLEGSVKENGNAIRKFETALKQDIKYYEKEVDFVQVVKLKRSAKTNLSGKIEFVVCNEKLCLPASEVELQVYIGS